MKKLCISSIVFLLITCGWGAYSVAQEPPAPRGELRIVDEDPGNWASITMNVMEHLMEADNNGTLVPRLATGWQWLDDHTLEVRLRQGVRFHNGELFDAEIVKLNWEENIRLRQPHRMGTFMNFHAGSRLDIIDPYTVRFIFPDRQPPVLSRTRLGRERLVNYHRSRPVGHGSI